MTAETILAVLNPATGTDLPVPLFIISGVILVGCIVGAVIAGNSKKKKTKKNNRRK